jgi:F420-non-reducing hydrogenase small subunit
MEKPKVAFYWCASCGGCEEAVVDLGEEILNVVDLVDIVFCLLLLILKLTIC